MVRLLHLADLHLDSPFRGVRRVDSALARRYQDASLAALDRAVDLALRLKSERGLDAVTFGGDVFDAEQPSLRARSRFSAALARLSAAGVPSLIVAGNHDPLDAPNTWDRVDLPLGATLFPAQWASVDLRQGDRVVANVCGRSYAESALGGGALDGLPAAGAPLSVGLLHGDVDGPTDPPSYRPVALDALRSTHYDAWLLGHVHAARQLSDNPLVLYPGTTQGRDFGPGEIGAKGAYFVQLAPGEAPVAEFWPLAPIVWQALEVDVAHCTSDTECVQTVRAAIDRAVAALPGCEGLLARLTLTGDGADPGLRRELSRLGKADEIAESLRSDGPPTVSVQRVETNLRGTLADRDELRGRDDLLGDLAKLADDLEQSFDAAASSDLVAALALFGAKNKPSVEFVQRTGPGPDPARLVDLALRAIQLELDDEEADQ